MTLASAVRALLYTTLAFALGSADGKSVGVKLKEAKMFMELAGKQWSRAEYDERSVPVLYIYQRDPLLDAQGEPVVPNIAVTIEELPLGKDVAAFSASKRAATPFTVDRMLTHQGGDLKYKNAIGFQGRYTGNDREHTVLVVHAINGLYGVELICDVPSELFEQVAPEFRSTVRSLR